MGLSGRKMMYSPLLSQSSLSKKNKKGKRNLVASLMLTSLVDAFSILVIFLMMNHSSSLPVDVSQNLQLPTTKEGALIGDAVTVTVSGDGAQFEIDKKNVGINSLVATLKSARDAKAEANKNALMIIADKEMNFADLNPVIVAGSHAGFTHFKFAVVNK